MKKLLICLILAIALSNCEVSVKKANSQIIKTLQDSNGRIDICIYQYTVDGIDYRIVHTGVSYGGTSVINLTKDKLEIELLKKQLAK